MGPKKGGKAGKGKGKVKQPEVEEESEVDEQGENEEEEEMGDEEEGMEGEQEEDDDDDDDEMEMDEGVEAELEISEAVNNAVGAIATLPTPDAVRTALSEVKEQIKTLLYTSTVGQMFKAVVEGASETQPFGDAEKLPAQKLFSRCSVTSHGAFRDDEFTLGPRRDVCGAATSIEIAKESGEEEIQISMVWYWRHDEEDGWVEEYALTMDDEASEEEGGEGDDEEGDEDGAEVKVITLMEGTRSQWGKTEASVNVEALRGLEEEIESGLALQTLLRFLVVVTRTECDKTQGKPASIAEGFDEDEDAEQMRSFLCRVLVEGEEPDVGQSSKKDKKRKAAPAAAPGKKKGAGKKAKA